MGKQLARGLSALTLCLMSMGCSTNLDGSHTFGARSSPGWAANAPKQDAEAYYDAKSVPELCATWKSVFWEGRRVEPILVQITKSLQRRGMDPRHCDNECRGNSGVCKPKLF